MNACSLWEAPNSARPLQGPGVCGGMDACVPPECGDSVTSASKECDSGGVDSASCGLGGVAGADAPNAGGQGWLTVFSAPDGAASYNSYGGPGGFGGGGGGGWGLAGNQQHSAGGGGGYSDGGICTTNFYSGGGGGSYDAGANPSGADDVRDGHGLVNIELL